MGLQESKWEALIFGTGAFIGILLLGGVSMELDTMQPLILSLGLVVAIVKLCNSPNQRFISLHLGTLRKSDLIPVLLFVLIHPNYDLLWSWEPVKSVTTLCVNQTTVGIIPLISGTRTGLWAAQSICV